MRVRSLAPAALPSSSTAARRSRLVVARQQEGKDEEGATSDRPSFNVASLIGYAFFLVYLSPIAIRAADRSGLIKVPPINTLTEIADNAADEAMAAGTLVMGTFFGYTLQGGTFYAQNVWKDLLAQYYATGESTAFLTEAGGVCAQHAAWCAGVVIPPP